MMSDTTKFLAIASIVLLGSILDSSPGSADDSGDVVFECQFISPDSMKGYHSRVVADGTGITVTQYDNDNKYVRSYTTNEKDGGRTSYYRKNKFEVSWGNNYVLGGNLTQLSSFIDRRTGILKNSADLGGDKGGRTETANCIPQ